MEQAVERRADVRNYYPTCSVWPDRLGTGEPQHTMVLHRQDSADGTCSSNEGGWHAMM